MNYEQIIRNGPAFRRLLLVAEVKRNVYEKCHNRNEPSRCFLWCVVLPLSQAAFFYVGTMNNEWVVNRSVLLFIDQPLLSTSQCAVLAVVYARCIPCFSNTVKNKACSHWVGRSKAKFWSTWYFKGPLSGCRNKIIHWNILGRSVAKVETQQCSKSLVWIQFYCGR